MFICCRLQLAMGHCSGAASAFPTSFKNSFVVVVLAVLALFPLPALTVTDPREKAALLTFKNSLIDDGYMLTGWDEFTDPCIDQWRGILCTCLTDFEDKVGRRIPVCSPIDPGYVTNYSRVLQLNLGDVRITDWNFLQGNLPPALGDLTALRILNLRNNNFTGSIPLEWAAMKNLEQLVLAGNNITGAVIIIIIIIIIIISILLFETSIFSSFSSTIPPFSLHLTNLQTQTQAHSPHSSPLLTASNTSS